MEKRTIIQLPEAMIQHIQSFLSGKEAAKTSILSKSWYSAWLTRPNLVFDERHFIDYQRFSVWSNNTLQRYRHLNLKIDSFKFWMGSFDKVCSSLANELIVEAIKMGATDITFELCTTSKFVLPLDLLESETLVRLSVAGCKIEGGNLRCWRLKYLNLRQVLLQEDLFWDIISSCPLIEGLELHECKRVVINRLWNLCDGPVNQFELHKLKTLFLYKVKICSLFFSDFSSRFPCLKDLSVHNCSGYNKIKICSQSLEFISFKHGRMILKADFDVPNLRKFCFSSVSFLPSVSFPNSCNWESHITIPYCRDLSAKWFLNLNKLLTKLSFSKVSLNLHGCYYFRNICKAGYTRCLPKPLVENLTIDLECSIFALFDSLFHLCRPVYVKLRWHPKYSYINRKGGIEESLEIVYEKLMQQDGVEVVSVGVFDKVVSGWRTVPWKSLLDASTSGVGEQRIHFHLRWG